MSENRIYKPRPISGFPEWLPEYRIIEQQWMDHIRKTFEAYGYCSIETPSVEEVDVLSAKGEVDKEIYVIQRLHADPNDKGDARLALHFDQTVPLARYVAQHFSSLTFPFKRYQMQRVWRGERPQLGRSREFYQCDIDVIGQDDLSIHFDAEMPAVIYEALEGLGLGRIKIRISNRKILLGLIEGLGITDAIAVTRTVDKLDKIGVSGVRNLLMDDVGLSQSQTDQIMALATISCTPQDASEKLLSMPCVNDTMKQGLEELVFVLKNLAHLPSKSIIGDLSIVRGLDYYTGTVYETRLLDIPEFTSSVCSGGRYDDLASNYINRKLPGVGISIGFTRLFEVLHHYGHIKPGPKTPTDILVVLPSEGRRADASFTAQTLRKRGFRVELYHSGEAKIKKQMEYAVKKGIPFVWFPPFDDNGAHEVKDMSSGNQSAVLPESWQKP